MDSVFGSFLVFEILNALEVWKNTPLNSAKIFDEIHLFDDFVKHWGTTLNN